MSGAHIWKQTKPLVCGYLVHNIIKSSKYMADLGAYRRFHPPLCLIAHSVNEVCIRNSFVTNPISKIGKL